MGGFNGAGLGDENEHGGGDHGGDDDGAMRIMKWMVTTTDMWTTPLSAKIFTMLMLPVVVEMP